MINILAISYIVTAFSIPTERDHMYAYNYAKSFTFRGKGTVKISEPTKIYLSLCFKRIYSVYVFHNVLITCIGMFGWIFPSISQTIAYDVM